MLSPEAMHPDSHHMTTTFFAYPSSVMPFLTSNVFEVSLAKSNDGSHRYYACSCGCSAQPFCKSLYVGMVGPPDRINKPEQ